MHLNSQWELKNNLKTITTMMLNGFNRGGILDCTPNINKFESKSEALKFAIEFTANYTEDGTRVANLTAAQEVFDFICKNVELPETQLAQWGDVIANANDIAEMVKQHFVELMNKAKANENTAG